MSEGPDAEEHERPPDADDTAAEQRTSRAVTDHASEDTADGRPGADTRTRAGAGRDAVTAGSVTTHTTDRRTLSPRVRVQWAVGALVAAAVAGGFGLFAAARVGFDPRLGVGLGVAAGLLGLVGVVLRYRVWAYEVRADALYLERGVLTHRRTLVPHVRVQHVDTARGPLERALGLSTLVVYTAGSRGADVSVPGLTPEQAADLQTRLKELTVAVEGGDAV